MIVYLDSPQEALERLKALTDAALRKEVWVIRVEDIVGVHKKRIEFFAVERPLGEAIGRFWTRRIADAIATILDQIGELKLLTISDELRSLRFQVKKLAGEMPASIELDALTVSAFLVRHGASAALREAFGRIARHPKENRVSLGGDGKPPS